MKTMFECRTCNAETEPFMSFGKMPIANGFLLPEEFGEEKFFELAPAICTGCGTFQIVDQPKAEDMFHEHYAFFTRTSTRMVAHFNTYADWVLQNWIDENTDPFVVELGSNDGVILENFAKRDIRHLGVEPSDNVADVARQHGVNTQTSFFGEDSAKTIRATYGAADVILAANVMCHIPDLHDVARGVCNLLSSTGILIFEDPYLGDMVNKTSYDQIYDEHVYIFSALSVKSIFGPHGLELIDVLPQDTHGGSMRYVLARKDMRTISPSVAHQLNYENQLKLDKIETFLKFKANCEASRSALKKALEGFKQGGKRVVGYGATSKSTTVLNYCAIGPDLIEFISDTTPIKQNKFSPGMHVPVKSHAEFKDNYPDVALLFAWNHRDEIIANEVDFAAQGNQWLNYVPKVEIL